MKAILVVVLFAAATAFAGEQTAIKAATNTVKAVKVKAEAEVKKKGAVGLDGRRVGTTFTFTTRKLGQ